MPNIGSYEAKTKLPEILRHVESGESYTITNRGKPVAEIIPIRSDTNSKAITAIDNILKAKKHIISDDTLTELKEDGRR